MNEAGIREALEQARGQALVFHGYTDYMRDYDLIVFRMKEAQAGGPARHFRYRFTTCVLAMLETGLPAKLLSASLGDDLLAPPTGPVSGYPWGARWQRFEPGAQLIKGSRSARKWSSALSITMHEARMNLAAHNMTLVFHDLEVTEVPAGYRPFVVGGEQDVPPEAELPEEGPSEGAGDPEV